LGVVAGWTGAPTDQQLPRRMAEASPHRGAVIRAASTPNGFVAVTGDDDVKGLADEDGWVIAYAGSIDNAGALGLPEDADGDRVAAALLERVRRGDVAGTLSRLRGPFAMIVVTPDSLIAARDHIGLCSLFFHQRASKVFLASEAKQVLAGAGIPREPDLDVVEAIFFATPSEDLPSALSGVERAPRRSWLTFKDGARVKADYWDPAALLETSSIGLDDFPEAFDSVMDTAVRRVMRGPDAVSLSGGIDSPAVASYAAPAHREVYGSPLAAASLVYPNAPSVDETRYIEIVAGRLGMPLYTRAASARPTDDLEHWVRLLDGPFPVMSVAESFEFYGWVRSLGYQVILTGEWAEFVTEMNTHVLTHLVLNGRLPAAVARYRRERAAGRPAARVVRRLFSGLTPDPIRLGVRRALGRPRHPRPDWITGRSIGRNASVSPRARWTTEQLNMFAGTGIMLDTHDVIVTQQRVDVRRPFADVDLLEFFLGLRAEVKHGDPRRKGLLRTTLRGRVPDEILDRRDKTVFNEDVLARIDYETLERWLIRPKYRLSYIDYDLLEATLKRRNLELREFIWMKDLAAIQAFLEEW
jgi:asparagine synthase (glutamine-hydrolysing)